MTAAVQMRVKSVTQSEIARLYMQPALLFITAIRPARSAAGDAQLGGRSEGQMQTGKQACMRRALRN